MRTSVVAQFHRWAFISTLLATLPARAEFTFVHPGLLQGAEDLSLMKRAVAAHQEPTFSGYEIFRKQPQSQSDYVMLGPLETVGRNPTVGEREYVSDANAAYQCALMWAITGERAYAEKSKEIINAWSGRLKSITGRDAVLMAGLGPFKMVNAAEIIRYTGAGWPESEARQAEKHFREVVYPVLKDFAPFANGNWDTAAMKTVMAIGVFCNDRRMFERAMRYYVAGDGDGCLKHYVINETGQCQESGRDQQHTQLGLAHLADCCEIAWHQGIDLYGYDDNRLLKGFEYTAKYNLGGEVPFAETLDRTGHYHHTRISPEGRGRLRAVFEQVYNHYVNRMGLTAPNTRKAAETVRPEGPGLPGADHTGFGTLLYTRSGETSGRQPSGPPVAPAGIVATGDASGIELAWVPVIGATNYIVKRRAAGEGAYATIAEGVGLPACLDRNVGARQMYYYVVASAAAAGRSADSPEVGVCAGLPGNWQHQDVGNVGSAGAARFDGRMFTIQAAGDDVGGKNDRFQFVYAPLFGDGEITARYVPQLSSQSTRFGVMLRESLADDAANVALLIRHHSGLDVDNPSWNSRLLVRAQAGADATLVGRASGLNPPVVTYGRLTGHCWLKLRRRGDEFSGFISTNGLDWAEAGRTTVSLNPRLFIGLCVCSGISKTSTTVTMDEVYIAK